jgi:hypothetical protein
MIKHEALLQPYCTMLLECCDALHWCIRYPQHAKDGKGSAGLVMPFVYLNRPCSGFGFVGSWDLGRSDS